MHFSRIPLDLAKLAEEDLYYYHLLISRAFISVSFTFLMNFCSIGDRSLIAQVTIFSSLQSAVLMRKGYYIFSNSYRTQNLVISS